MDGSERKHIWIIANWKSNKTIAQALEWVSIVGPNLERRDYLKVVVCPDFVCLEEVKKAVSVGNFPLMVGSQDLSPFDTGPYTGEEAAKDLEGLVELAILGHSERRKNFSETDEMVSRKVAQANASAIIPLVCVQGKETPVPEGCTLIAYEPVFAIGTGNADMPQDANEVAESFKGKYGPDLEVLYGGSVTSENCKSFLAQEQINGLLVGGASLDPQEFIRIVEISLGL